MAKLLMSFFLALAALLTGCSRMSLAYRFADTSTHWALDDHFDFKGDQSAKVKAELAKAKTKLRKEWIPSVTAEFRATAETMRTSPPQTEADAIKLLDQKEQTWENLFKAAWHVVTPEMKKASEVLQWHNWESFRKNYAKQSGKIKRESSGKCAGRLEDQVEIWTGSVTNEQEKRIDGYCKSNAWPPEERAKNRDFLLPKFEEFAGITEKSFNGPKFVDSLEAWSDKQREISIPEYKAKKEVSRLELKKTLAWMLLNLTEKQKKRFIDTLENRAQELDSLEK